MYQSHINSGSHHAPLYQGMIPRVNSAPSQTSSLPTKSSMAEHADADIIISDADFQHKQIYETSTINEGSIHKAVQDQRQHSGVKTSDSQSIPGSVTYTAYQLSDSMNLIEELRNVGVTVLSLDSSSTDAMTQYLNAVCSMKLGSESEETCILYTDQSGRLYNVVLSGGATALAIRHKIVQGAYTGWMSLLALVWLIRMTSAASSNNIDHALKQNLSIALTFMVGFILEYETSLTWMFSSLNIRGTNSVSAYVWRSPYTSLVDYPRYATLIVCILSCCAANYYQAEENSSDNETKSSFFLSTACVMTILLLLSNLGSWAWTKMNIPKIDSNFMGSFVVVQIASVLFGLLFGFMACIPSPITGKRARLHITLVSLLVAGSIFITDMIQWWDDKTNVTIAHNVLATWWMMSTVSSWVVCTWLEEGPVQRMEPFLKRDETSPVGWIVPCIPNVIMEVGWKRSETSFFTDIFSLSLLVFAAAWLIYQSVSLISREERTNLLELF